MRNGESINSHNKVTQSRKEIEEIIKQHWSNLLGCSIADFDNGIVIIKDSENPRLANTKKSSQEIQVFNFKNTGTIINVPDILVEKLVDLIRLHGVNSAKMGELLQSTFNGELQAYHSVRSYLFDQNKLLPIDPNIRRLGKHEKTLFDKFMEKCSEQDRYEVYMDFEADFHNFYAYFVDGEIVALGEFCKINMGDTIVLPSIITREDQRKKGYGKAVINAISHKIIELGLVPQYRCDPENHGSRAIAKSPGYEEIVSGFSLQVISNNS